MSQTIDLKVDSKTKLFPEEINSILKVESNSNVFDFTTKELISNETVANQYIANQFWTKFMVYEKIIYDNMMKKNIVSYNQSVNIVETISKDLNIQTKIGTYFGIDTRNGMVLSERKDHIEFIISPLFHKSNQKLVHALYDESFKHKLPSYWSIIKYKFHQPSYIHTIVLNYTEPIKEDNKEMNLIEITKDDFSYYPIVNDKKTQISILLFIKDDKAKYLTKKEKYNDREILVPVDNGIHAMMDSAIGEYNLLNIIDKMEIHLESDLEKDEFKEIEPYKIENIVNDVEMINNHSLSKFHKCSRCEYSNYHVKLYICKCKKVYYCNSICQKAHRELHILGGC